MSVLLACHTNWDMGHRDIWLLLRTSDTETCTFCRAFGCGTDTTCFIMTWVYGDRHLNTQPSACEANVCMGIEYGNKTQILLCHRDSFTLSACPPPFRHRICFHPSNGSLLSTNDLFQLQGDSCPPGPGVSKIVKFNTKVKLTTCYILIKR